MSPQHAYIRRQCEGKLKQLAAHFPVVVVSGARQVGKSTLLEHTFPQYTRIVFDPIMDIENARSEPDLFLDHRKPPIILDEIQYAPELVPAIKRRLEKDRKPGQYLLTGSQQWGVMKLLSESLAGRAAFLDLEGFSLPEIAKADFSSPWLERWLKDPVHFLQTPCKKLSLPFPLYEQIWRGFLPETEFLPANLIPDFHLAYQRTYIERDIQQLADVSDLQLFSRFFRLCAALTAQEINFSQLGRELGITPQTAGRWLELLKATFQWYEVPPYSGNTIKRISGKPKGYLCDTGLACFAQAVSSFPVLGSHPLWGALFETACISEIRKACRLMQTPPNIYHWRSHGGAEVDVLLEWNGLFYPIEIKGKTKLDKNDARGIEAFKKNYPRLKTAKGLILAPVETAYSLDKEVVVAPWDIL
ncbi:MAG: DUF4143 domain-containing protein [Deltaproteobacteria bacterium]|nr:DUF4143 domain-containing protein [Deltaproteobacteria bacterium]